MTIASVSLFAAFAALEISLRAFGWSMSRSPRRSDYAISRYTVLPASACVAVIAVSFADRLALFGEPTAARMAAGALLCLLALLIRYPLAMPGLLPWDLTRRIFRVLPMLHPRYVGLLALLAGLSAILGSPLGVAASVVLLPLVVRIGLRLRPVISTAAILVGGPGLLYLAVAFPTREVALFNSDAETARTLVLSVAGAQGTWGILAVSFTVVLLQIVASSYSPSLTRTAGMRWPLVCALGFLASSVIYDVVVVARSGDWIVAHPERGAALVDGALLLGGVVLAAVGWAALQSMRDVAPERLMARLLEKFDRKWVSSLTGSGGTLPGHREMKVDDPSRAVEGLLRALAEKRDLGSMRIVLAQFGERLYEIEAYRHWQEVDAHLHFCMAPLIRLVGKEMGEDALEEWIALVNSVGGLTVIRRDALANIPWVSATPSRPTPGEALLRQIVSVALDNRHAAVAARGLGLVRLRAEGLLDHLPLQKDTILYNPERGAVGRLSTEERDRRRKNDRLIVAFQSGYVGYIGEAGATAARAALRDVVWSASSDLCRLVSDACAQVKDSPVIRARVVGSALGQLDRLVRASGEVGLTGAVSLDGLESAVDNLNPDRGDDVDLALAVARQVAAIVDRLSRKGALDYAIVDYAGIIGATTAGRFPDAALMVVEAMGDALHFLPQFPRFPDEEEASVVIQELRSGIEVIASSAQGNGADAVKRRATEILAAGRGKADPA